MSWSHVKLGDVLTLKRGYDLPDSNREAGKVPIVSSSGVTGYHSIPKVQGPGVVTGRYGTLGEVYFIEEPFWPLNTALYVQDFKENDPRFISYFLEFALRGILSDKAAVPGVNRNDLHARDVLFPDRDTQLKIAVHLAIYDDLIENNGRRIKLLEKSAGLLYREWFVRLRFPGHEHVKIVDGVPEGWRRAFVPEIIEVNPKEKIANGSETRYVPMSSLSEEGMTVNSSLFESRTKSTSVKFRNEDVLFPRITPCLENGKTGFVNFLDDGEVACGSSEFIILRGREVSPEFTYCLSRSYDFRENAIKSMIGSSGRQRVQTSCFNEFLVALPPATLLSQFEECAYQCFRQIQILNDQNRKLSRARDLLLPRLMSGEIAV